MTILNSHPPVLTQTEHFSARSFLVGVGAKLASLQLFSPIHEGVKIAQKTVKDSPSEKLYDGFIGLLCGATGMVEVNKLVRSDWAEYWPRTTTKWSVTAPMKAPFS